MTEKAQQPSFFDEKGNILPEIEIMSKFPMVEQREKITELVNEGKTIAEAAEILRQEELKDNLDAYTPKK